VLREDTDANGVLGFSPDGSSLLLGALEKDERGLARTVWRVVPAAGGAPTATFRLSVQASGLRWAPDSRSVSYLDRADPAYNVRRQSFTGTAPETITRFATGRVMRHEWSPDGLKLALVVRSGKNVNLWVTDADGSNAVQVTQFSSEQVFGVDWMPDSRRILVTAGTSASDAVLIREFR
jgi:Tol biopolymer transport system component